MIIRGGFKGPDYNVTVSVSAHDNLTFLSWITRTAETVREWEISCRACITAARHLALSLEKLQAHPVRGPSNNAWKETTRVCLYKSITKGNRGLGQACVCKAQPLELTFATLRPLAAVVHPEAVECKWCMHSVYHNEKQHASRLTIL